MWIAGESLHKVFDNTEAGVIADVGAPPARDITDRIAAPDAASAQPRCVQPGIGNTSFASALATGSTARGLPSRFCTAAEIWSGVCPLASKWIAPPIITRLARLVARSASTSACGAVEPARLWASAQTSMPSNEKPALRSND